MGAAVGGAGKVAVAAGADPTGAKTQTAKRRREANIRSKVFLAPRDRPTHRSPPPPTSLRSFPVPSYIQGLSEFLKQRFELTYPHQVFLEAASSWRCRLLTSDGSPLAFRVQAPPTTTANNRRPKGPGARPRRRLYALRRRELLLIRLRCTAARCPTSPFIVVG
uniref:Uncharacterized protein n=1 Tax=Plectus sambesii TaxID=2011161 RepID=A0A914UZA3_9BILA